MLRGRRVDVLLLEVWYRLVLGVLMIAGAASRKHWLAQTWRWDSSGQAQDAMNTYLACFVCAWRRGNESLCWYVEER